MFPDLCGQTLRLLLPDPGEIDFPEPTIKCPSLIMKTAVGCADASLWPSGERVS